MSSKDVVRVTKKKWLEAEKNNLVLKNVTQVYFTVSLVCLIIHIQLLEILCPGI